MTACRIKYTDHAGRPRVRFLPWSAALDFAFVHLLLDDLTNIVGLRSNRPAKRRGK